MVLKPTYSTLFSCLYDQRDAATPSWSHHSIFRAVEYRDGSRKLHDTPVLHDFAVIWDDDHDERIIEAIERIYMAGLLAPVVFIGEHKGVLTVIIASKSWFDMPEDAEVYAQLLQAVATVEGQDRWQVALGRFDRADRDIKTAQNTDLRELIGNDWVADHTYLLHLDGLWRLGTKPCIFPGAKPQWTAMSPHVAPPPSASPSVKPAFF